MEFSIKTGIPGKEKRACVVVGVFASRKLSAPAKWLDEASGGYISGIVRQGGMDGKAGSVLFLHETPNLPARRVLLVGLGKEKEFRDKAYGEAIRVAVNALGASGVVEGVLCLAESGPDRDIAWRVRQAVLHAEDARYRFDHYKSEKEDASRLRKLTLLVREPQALPLAETALAEGKAIAEGIRLARDLGNLPGNVCTPDYLAKEAASMADELGLSCQVLEEKAMRKLGMRALLAVAQGSRQPPRFIILKYHGNQERKAGSARPLVLVGKGITFDSGGISLKPAADMDEMKYDMCGAATVLGVMRAAARMALPLDLVALVPACENMPDGGAARPGDIVTSLSGQTIEILNTDAEGRLILCDALSYAERLKPAAVIDIATLTGACVVALGHVATGLFSEAEDLAQALLAAGEEARDPAWRLPLWEDYQELLKSRFADMTNTGGRYGGAITAACFLSRFARKYAWAHLDIAGTAWRSGPQKGATGRPVSLLAHFLLQRAKTQAGRA
jgi:leucyl aminopeptidase